MRCSGAPRSAQQVKDTPRWMHARWECRSGHRATRVVLGNYGVLIDELFISSEVGGDWTKRGPENLARFADFTALYPPRGECSMTKTAECS